MLGAQLAMKLHLVGMFLATVLGTTPVFADGVTACLDSADSGQTLRASHKLIEARAQFGLCAASTCPSAVQADCTKWVAEADKAIPTVVLGAKDDAGNDTFDVKVTVDGAPFANKLEGTALPVDPGAHTFRFQRPDGTWRERQVLVEEGQKAIPVAVTFAAPFAVAPRGPARPLGRTLGWIVGAVGIAGLGVGAVFTGITLSDKSAGDCDASGACHNFGAVNSARSVAPVAGAGLIGGGALVVTGAALLLFTRSSGHGEGPTAREKVALRAAPVIHPQGGGMVLEGVW
jgi:hypothetical protein